MKNIAVFVSGSGSNAENIARYFAASSKARVAVILSNNPDAYALTRAAHLGIDTFVFTPAELKNPSVVLAELRRRAIDYVVLAGFLLFIPDFLTEAYPDQIVNIHPSLLPKYGGKGMYGDHVHRAVIQAGEKESGITIHRVNGAYDSGGILFQASCPVLPDDTPDSLASRVHALEYAHFPRVIEREIRSL